MFKYLLKIAGCSCAIGLFSACADTNSKPLSIVFSADSTKILFNHIDPSGLLQLKNDKSGDSLLNTLIAVLHTPSALDSTFKEEAVPGLIAITDSNFVFTPQKPFVKGQDYLVVTHLNIRFGTPEQVLKGQLNYSMKPQQQLLRR